MRQRTWKSVVSGQYWQRSRIIAVSGLLIGMIWGWQPDMSLALGCEQFPTAEDWDANNFQHEGFYSNCRFGYAVRLPDGVIGGVSKPHAPDHGIGIRYPKGMISVEGNYNVIDEWISAEAMTRSYVKWITQDAKQVLSLEELPVIVDGHSATRLIARFSCSDGTRVVNDYILIFSGGLTYTLSLRADAEKYADYKPVLEHLMASWQFRDLWCEVVCGDAYLFSSPEEWESVTRWGEYTEEYTNQEYGYTVTIPAGVVGKSAYPTIPAYGIGMLLSREGYLTVEGGCNWPKWDSLEDAVAAYVRWITAEAHSVDGVEQQPATLGGIPAVRLTVRYACPMGTPMVKDFFLAISNNTVYKIDLITTATHYDDDKPILEQFAETFRLTGAAKESCQWAEEGE